MSQNDRGKARQRLTKPGLRVRCVKRYQPANRVCPDQSLTRSRCKREEREGEKPKGVGVKSLFSFIETPFCLKAGGYTSASLSGRYGPFWFILTAGHIPHYAPIMPCMSCEFLFRLTSFVHLSREVSDAQITH